VKTGGMKTYFYQGFVVDGWRPCFLHRCIQSEVPSEESLGFVRSVPWAPSQSCCPKFVDATREYKNKTRIVH